MERISYPSDTEAFFSAIVEEIKQTLDPEYILIAGSFGKGSWLYDGKLLLSDFEFEFISKKKWSLKDKKVLLNKFNDIYDHEINLKGNLLQNVTNKVSSNYSKSYPGYVRLNFFDAFSDPQIIYAKKDAELDLKIDVNEIPAWEVWRLLANRIGDILSVSNDENASKSSRAYSWLKTFESIGDAYLILNNIYAKNIDQRYQLWTEELIQADLNLSHECKQAFELVASALFARKSHDIDKFEHDHVSANEKRSMVISWLTYVEDIVKAKEKFNAKELSFADGYLKTSNLQKKYLEVSNSLAIPISNLIRLVFNYKALSNLKFKIGKMTISWRHLILLIVTEFFKEQVRGDDAHIASKNMLCLVIPDKRIDGLTDNELNNIILKLWKVTR